MNHINSLAEKIKTTTPCSIDILKKWCYSSEWRQCWCLLCFDGRYWMFLPENTIELIHIMSMPSCTTPIHLAGSLVYNWSGQGVASLSSLPTYIARYVCQGTGRKGDGWGSEIQLSILQPRLAAVSHCSSAIETWDRCDFKSLNPMNILWGRDVPPPVAAAVVLWLEILQALLEFAGVWSMGCPLWQQHCPVIHLSMAATRAGVNGVSIVAAT